MKVKKAIRQKGCDYIMAVVNILGKDVVVSLDFFPHKYSLSINTYPGHFKLYEEDTKNYESITEESFNRVLRLVKSKISVI